jgi:hypothetical protein
MALRTTPTTSLAREIRIENSFSIIEAIELDSGEEYIKSWR